jgi:S-adenosylmethionine hydrolase
VQVNKSLQNDKLMRYIKFVFLLVIFSCSEKKSSTIVVQTDFGEKDGAVAAMKGVALNVSGTLNIFDLTHEIPAYNIWEAAYRLQQVYPYWPEGTVFVSVVDPGVGTERESVVAKTRSGKFIVTPDNGTLTLIEDVESIRLIDETINRRDGSMNSHTFHGRDVYMYTAAKLASGEISFEDVGKAVDRAAIKIPYQSASIMNNEIHGNIPVLDVQYGNVWTNIPDSMVHRAGIRLNDTIYIQVLHQESIVANLRAPFVKSFGSVDEGNQLSYINSLGNFAIAINMGDLAESYKIRSGSDWTVRLKK